LIPPIVFAIGPSIPGGQHREHDTSGRLNPVLSLADEHQVQIVVGRPDRRCVNLPYSLIRDAWITADGRPALALGVRIVVTQEDAYLEPLESYR
jgi:hypothetical protein